MPVSSPDTSRSAGAPHVVKRNVDAATADVYLRRLREIGVECNAEPEYLELCTRVSVRETRSRI